MTNGLLTSGGTCAYCLWRFTADTEETITMCPSCETPYHDDCFEENGGCATFGCPSWVSSLAAAGVPGVVAVPPSTPPSAPPTPPPGAPVVTPLAPARNFCSQCGTLTDATQDFCTQCGHRLGQ